MLIVSAWLEAGAYFTVRERAALEWAEVVTWVASNQVPDEAFLAAQGEFSDKELADLTVAIGLINVYNRIPLIDHTTRPCTTRRGTGYSCEAGRSVAHASDNEGAD